MLGPTVGNVSLQLASALRILTIFRLYALRALLNALAPIIGAEAASGNKAVVPGWANNASSEQITEWSKEGNKLILQELEDLFQKTCAEEYRRIMNKVHSLVYLVCLSLMSTV